jgi:hypothetical protein
MPRVVLFDVDRGSTATGSRSAVPESTSGCGFRPKFDACFPDYSLYGHDRYALGFLTRGCGRRCAFCVVPEKEGNIKQAAASFDAFVPAGQKNVMLLDDNLLSFADVEGLLKEMTKRRLAVNFSQTLDISCLSERIYELLLKPDFRNARFTRRRIYFSCNYPGTISHFTSRRAMLKGFGRSKPAPRLRLKSNCRRFRKSRLPRFRSGFEFDSESRDVSKPLSVSPAVEVFLQRDYALLRLQKGFDEMLSPTTPTSRRALHFLTLVFLHSPAPGIGDYFSDGIVISCSSRMDLARLSIAGASRSALSCSIFAKCSRVRATSVFRGPKSRSWIRNESL